MAANDDDVACLDEALHQLAHFLVTHIERERAQLVRLTPAEARILRRGHVRLVDSVRALTYEAANCCRDGPDRCAARTGELVALLTLQCHDERLAFCRRAR